MHLGAPAKRGDSKANGTPTTDPRSSKILAKSLFRDMSELGLDRDQVLSVASELIALVTEDLQRARDEKAGRA